MLLLLLRYWREGVIAIVLLFGVTMCVQRDHALVTRGVAIERNRKADSTIKAVNKRLHSLDSALTATTASSGAALEALRTDTLWRHDTVLVGGEVRIAVPPSTLVKQEEVQRSCSALANDCEAFRVSANLKIKALEDKVATVPTITMRSCTTSNVVVGTLSGVAGYFLGRR